MQSRQYSSRIHTHIHTHTRQQRRVPVPNIRSLPNTFIRSLQSTLGCLTLASSSTYSLSLSLEPFFVVDDTVVIAAQTINAAVAPFFEAAPALLSQVTRRTHSCGVYVLCGYALPFDCIGALVFIT